MKLDDLLIERMKAKSIGQMPSSVNPDPWRGERELAKSANDDKLLSLLASYKPGTEPHFIIQREIEQRKEAVREAREDKRFRRTEFRSWVAVGVSVFALAVALGVALYK